MRRVEGDYGGIWLLVYLMFIWVVVYLSTFRLERIDGYVKSIVSFILDIYYWWFMVGGIIS